MDDRKAVGLFEYKAPETNKPTLPYANVMMKLNLTRAECEAEAARLGLNIPPVLYFYRLPSWFGYMLIRSFYLNCSIGISWQEHFDREITKRGR